MTYDFEWVTKATIKNTDKCDTEMVENFGDCWLDDAEKELSQIPYAWGLHSRENDQYRSNFSVEHF